MRFTAILFGLLAFVLGVVLHAHFPNMAAPHVLKNPLPILTRLSTRLQQAGPYKSGVLPAVSSSSSSSITSISPLLPHQHLHTKSLHRAFSTTSPTMSASKTFMDAVKERRTYYALNDKAPVSDDRIVEIVNDAVLHVPSSFNSQSTRVVVLLKEEHKKFWELVKEVLKTQVPADAFPATEKKIDGFKAGYGSVLFFEDPVPVNDLQTRFPLYAQHFPTWSEHTSAMHQYVLWAGLEAEGFGANLQHYNPIIDQKVQNTWNVPQEWALRAQLVFGGRAGEPGDKAFQPLEQRVFVHGK